MKRYVLILLLVTAMCGCSKLKSENYAKIKTGIEYTEVVKILGTPDSCSEALFVKSCVWGDEKKNITVSFVADKAILSASRNIK